MPGLFDMLMAVSGRPTDAQLMAGLGQAPGQPGSNAPGPVPGAAPAGQAGGGAPPTQQGAPPAAQGAPQGQGAPAATMPGGQPAPTAFQSPSDLGQMYLQLAQRQQAEEGFNRGLGLLAASAYPGRRPDIIMRAMTGNTQDPAELFGNLMKLQTFGQQQQNLAAYRQNLPGMMKQLNLDPSMQPLLAANPDILSKIVETRAGVGGDAISQELVKERSSWHDQNPGKTDVDMIAARPELAGPMEFVTAKQAAGTEATKLAADKAAAASDFTGIHADMGETEQMLGWLKAHPDATVKAVQEGAWATGRPGQFQQWLGTVDQDTATAAADLQKLQGKLYGSSWKGRGGRLSQLEAGKISEGFSTLTNPSTPAAEINQQVGDLYNKTQTAHANAFGAAGMPTPSNYYGLMDSAYKKGGKLFAGATQLEDSGGGGGAPTGPGQGGGGGAGGQKLSADDLEQAKALIARDGRDAVIAHLKAKGYDTSGL